MSCRTHPSKKQQADVGIDIIKEGTEFDGGIVRPCGRKWGRR
jgi:hypothetical protein